MSRDTRAQAHHPPTPSELANAPELAALHALDIVTDLALRALVALHPELGDPEAPVWLREPSRVTTEASRILSAADPLIRHLRAYRTALALEQHQQLESDPDLLF